MQNIKLKQDKKRKKISLVYENIVEIDENEIEFEIEKLQAKISFLERQRNNVDVSIEEAKKKLELLQENAK